MKAATVVQLRRELETLDPEHLKSLCLRLARFKLENKELLTYLLFESENESYYIEGIKETADLLFEEINTKSYFYIKKSVRKILRMLKKHARYSNKKETEICEALSEELKKKELILVGLDIIGNYLTEINVTSPTGVQEISKFDNFNISSKFWDSVESYI